MQIPNLRPLFAWDTLEDSPTIRTLREFLTSIPDEEVSRISGEIPGQGAERLPGPCALGDVAFEDRLAASDRGVVPGRTEAERGAAEADWDRIGGPGPQRLEHVAVHGAAGPGTVSQPPAGDVQHDGAAVGEVVPDLGENLAGDATGLKARRKEGEAAEEEKAEGLPQPKGGRKEYTDKDGNVTRVVEWFGFKLHLAVDVKHEVVLGYKVTESTAGDAETLPAVLEQVKRNLPQGRIKSLAYDKAADTNPVHELLSREGIKAVIENRSLWKEETERMLPGHDGNSNIVYDEAGTVYCYDRVSQPMVRYRMAYIGYEPSRETIKYRCPAKHEGWECPMSKICNAGKSYGKTVRVPREIDLRRFPAIPRATRKFERLYRGRTAVERVNARLKVFWGVDDGNIVGARRFTAEVGAVMVVHAAFATLLAMAPRREGTLGKMRLSPISKALRERVYGKPAAPGHPESGSAAEQEPSGKPAVAVT
ncbi:MAG: hypothetical protein KatS3mg110_0881 [Pirellulaceae bacterium]|nr:MAG: hypothetical protein KatS3mg110_0881 [Pirellulaceae bacterium]